MPIKITHPKAQKGSRANDSITQLHNVEDLGPLASTENW